MLYTEAERRLSVGGSTIKYRTNRKTLLTSGKLEQLNIYIIIIKYFMGKTILDFIIFDYLCLRYEHLILLQINCTYLRMFIVLGFRFL